MSIRLTLALLLLPLSGLLFAASQDTKPAPMTMDRAQQFVFHSVLEGLYTDGVSNEVLDVLMTRDEETGFPHHFIYACPVCMPSWDAFAAYRARPGFLGDKIGRTTWGAGLDQATRQSLLEGTRLERMERIRDLVTRWVGARMDRQRLTQAERAVFQKQFERMRKKGMGYLESYKSTEGLEHIYQDVEYCPFCDGAYEAPGR